MKKIESLDEIKQIELNVLIYIDQICKKNNIRYFLAYGTLLGAIRHKGFIPWDDDIDITMPRPDYEKFVKIMKKDNSFYDLINLEISKKDYSYPFAKVYDSRTRINEPWRPMKEEIGVYVDVFPLDGLGNKKEKAEKRARKLLKMTKWIWYLENVKNTNLKGKILNVIGRKNINRLLTIILKRNNFYDSKYIGMVLWPDDNIEIIESKYYLDIEEGVFEGNIFPIPKYYNEILTNNYGEYSDYPSKEQQVPMHPYEAWWID